MNSLLAAIPDRYVQFKTTAMKVKFIAILTTFICLFCVLANVYWLFHKDYKSGLFIKINISTALLLILLVLLPAIQQKPRNEQEEKHLK